MAAGGSAVKQMSAQQIAEYESCGSITLAGEVLTAGEIRVLHLPILWPSVGEYRLGTQPASCDCDA